MFSSAVPRPALLNAPRAGRPLVLAACALTVCVLAVLPTPARAQAFKRAETPGFVGVTGGRVAAGDFNGDGRADLLVSGVSATTTVVTRIFVFAGEQERVDRGDTSYVATFNAVPIGIEQLYSGDVLLADVNADGRADVLVSGRRAAATPDPVTALYLNTGNATLGPAIALGPALYNARLAFRGGLLARLGRTAGGALRTDVLRLVRSGTTVQAQPAATLEGVEFGAAAWGDCDGDGDFDLAVTGMRGTLPSATLYRNDGGAFVPLPAALPGVFLGDVAWADVDGDGDEDLALTGHAFGPALVQGVTRLYRMDACAPAEVPLPAPYVAGHTIRFGDATGDGRADLVVSGLDGPLEAGRARTFVLAGDGAGAFALAANTLGTLIGGGALLDYNNDGRLDVALTGTVLGATGFVLLRGPGSVRR